MYLKILCRLQKSHNIVSVRLARLLFLKYNTDHLFPKFPIFWGGGTPNPWLCIKNSAQGVFSTTPFHSHSALSQSCLPWNTAYNRSWCSMKKSQVWKTLSSWKVKIYFFILKVLRSITFFFFNQFFSYLSHQFCFVLFFNVTYKIPVSR